MKILVVGNGGREDCICWKVKSSPLTTKLYCAPGNPGTARWAENIPLSVDAISEITTFAVENKIDLCVIGPEVPLSLGLADLLAEKNIKVFGPNQVAAELEASKAFAKEIMIAAGVPTAGYKKVLIQDLEKALQSEKLPFVLKADGLAAGKGVVVCLETEDVAPALSHLRDSVHATSVIIEEFLEGIEVSCIYACHELHAIALSTAHDYKRLKDNDAGPNTGGMGTVSPSPRLSGALHASVLENVIIPTLKEMQRRGKSFSGFLYAGLMLLGDGSYRVLEFNTRLGDPETQVLLPRLKSDLVSVLCSLLDGKVPELVFDEEYKICLVLASKDYPQSSSKGDVINGIEFAEQRNGMVFHAGTAIANNTIVTNGGRVLNIVGGGKTLDEARSNAYGAADLVQFQGRQLRRDIGLS